MPDSLSELRQQREGILQQIHAVDRLRRGTLSEQFFVKKRHGKTIRHGPYYVLQCYLKGHKCSERVPAGQAPQVKSDVANYQRFQQLAERFVQLTEQITRLEDGPTHAKKNSSPRRSSKNSLAKPGPS